MASAALTNLQARLRDVDEILAARDAICPAGAGRPAQRKGAAVIAGGTVLLSALFEGFIEDLFELAIDALHPGVANGTRTSLKEHTSRKNNNANVHQVNTLFFYLGVPWVMAHSKVHWQKFSNANVQERLGKLSRARNELAHGKVHAVTKPMLNAWRDFIGRLAEKLDEIAADRVQTATGVRPW
jgi:hypothetical protein